MKSHHIMHIATIVIFVTMAAGPAAAAKGGNKEWPGPNDPVFTVESGNPFIPAVDSHSLDDAQIVFYGAQVDLSIFEGKLENGDPCFHADSTGTLVIHRASRKNPQAAELVFWFPGMLESGEYATHSFTMQGWFDEPDNWPPTVGDPVTTVTFEYWEFEAENKWAQRLDCAGSYDYSGAGPWTVTVTRKP